MSTLNEHATQRARASLRSIVSDAPTELTSLNLIADALEQQLTSYGRIALLYIHLEHYGQLESVFGWRVVAGVLDTVAQCLHDMAGSTLRQLDAISDFTLTDNGFLVILSPPREGLVADGDVGIVMRRVEARLWSALANTLEPDVFSRIYLATGAAVHSLDTSLTFEQNLERILARAMQAAAERETRHVGELVRLLADVIEHDEIEPQLDAVVNADAGTIIGYRSMVRGPVFSSLRLPDVLFDIAQRSAFLASYGVAARQATIKAAETIRSDQLLFLPCGISELPNAAVVVLSELYASNNSLVPQHVVIDIDAVDLRAGIALSVRKLNHVREMGFQLCVSGINERCLPIELISEVRPEFLCLGPSVAGGVTGDPTSTDVTQLLVRVGHRVGAQVIAAGVRRHEQYRVLASSGVALFTGEYFTRPDTRPVDDFRH